MRNVLLQLWVVCRDEFRLVFRSRRGRVAWVSYSLAVLYPALGYLVMRSRFVIPWPMDASDFALYLRGYRGIDIILVLVLAHDLLTRGDREGWQDGVATLPVGETTWLFGRLLGRLLPLVTIMATPLVIGWGIASIWAGTLLSAVPFVSVFISHQTLSLVLLYPLAVTAGCLGNSIIGATVVFFCSLIAADALLSSVLIFAHRSAIAPPLLGVSDLNFVSLFVEGPQSAFDESSLLVHALLEDPGRNSGYLRGWYLPPFRPDGGLLWPPIPSDTKQVVTLWIAAFCWLGFLSVAPFLLRLRRRAGRLQLQIPSIPSFSRWAMELFDQIRPTRPEGVAARWLTKISALLLLVLLAWSTIEIAEFGGNELELLAVRSGQPASRPWPARFELHQRQLDLNVKPDGLIVGEAILTGEVIGNPDRPLVFALAPGFEVGEISSNTGVPFEWTRDPEHVWINDLGLGKTEISFTYEGRPRFVSTNPMRWFGDPEPTWSLLHPVLRTETISGLRPLMIDLQRLAWAPEPLMSPALEGAFANRMPCRGQTSLKLVVPDNLEPMPLPGLWNQQDSGSSTEVTWRGAVPFLPPIVAGQLHVARIGEATAVAQSSGTDVDGVLRLWLKAWDDLPPLASGNNFVLCSLREGRTSRSEPKLINPAGIFFLGRQAELRRGIELDHYHSWAIRSSRARLRFSEVSHRLDGLEPANARRFLWFICRQLEPWSSHRPSLLVDVMEQHGFVSARLDTGEMRTQLPESFNAKLERVVAGLLELIGSAEVERGLARISKGTGPLTMREIWTELAGERAEELDWFYDSMFCKRGLSDPRIVDLRLEEDSARFHVSVELENRGSVVTVLPIRFIAANQHHDVQVRLSPGQTTTINKVFESRPDQVLIDPERKSIRLQPVGNTEWTRWGGLR